MKIQKTIEQILGENPLEIERIDTGLTNDNYHVRTLSHDVVLRMPKQENEGLFDYKHEGFVLNLIEPYHLEPHLVYYNHHSGIKCAHYVEHAQTFTLEYIERAAELMRKLHHLKLKSGKVFSIKEHFQIYQSRIREPFYDLSFVVDIMDQADAFSHQQPSLCHNDLVPGNFLFTKDHDYLIDFEYAMDNDPCSDVMSFLTENDITDPVLRNRFYCAYFGALPTPDLQRKLDVFEIAHHALWCSWAMMMFESHKDPIYRDIADLKYKRLQEVFAKESSIINHD